MELPETFVRLTPAEVINDAIMSGQAALVLEGITDFKTYAEVSSCLSREVVLKPVELIDGYGEGCQQVIQLICDLEDNLTLSPHLAGRVIGIIDKDVREFRGELPVSANIVVLRAYSMESHFVCSEVIERCLTDFTYISQGHQISGAADALFADFTFSLDKLFLGSSDALRGAVEVSYNPKFSYSDNFGRLKDQNLLSQLQGDSISIRSFAASKGLSCDLISLKKFVKGKVLLDAFCDFLSCKFEVLPMMCQQQVFQRCDYCSSGLNAKCMYRRKKGVTDIAIRNCIAGQFPRAEFQYLIDDLQARLS